MTKTVGYLAGTDPEFLTRLVCKGYRTLPIGNGVDKHGKNIAYISIEDKIDLIVGYLHKISPVPKFTKSFKDLLTPAIIHKIPILLLVPKDVKSGAVKILSDIKNTPEIKLVDPKNLMNETMKILE